MSEDTYRGEDEDPLSLNLYSYVSNEPIMYSDPTGHWQQSDKNIKNVETQAKIIALTSTYYYASSKKDQDAIAVLANKLRNSLEAKVTEITPLMYKSEDINKVIEKAVGTKGVLSNKQWNDALAGSKIATVVDGSITSTVIGRTVISVELEFKKETSKIKASIGMDYIMNSGERKFVNEVVGAHGIKDLPQALAIYDFMDVNFKDRNVQGISDKDLALLHVDTAAKDIWNVYYWAMKGVSVDEAALLGFQDSSGAVHYAKVGATITALAIKGKMSAKVPVSSYKNTGKNEKPSVTQSTNKPATIGCNCFTAGTKVLTDQGEKPIEEIGVGDKVLSKDDETGEIAYKEVEWLFQREGDETYNITVGSEVITTTGEHPFWIIGKGWVKSKDIVVGEVLTTSDGNVLAIEKIDVKKEHKTVYNFKVKDFHTYFVSNLGIWTHNSCFTWTGKGYTETGKNMSADDFVKNMEGLDWKKEVQSGGKKSGPAIIFTDPKTGTKARIHATPGEGTPYYRVQNKGGNYLNDDGVFPSNATTQDPRDQTHFYFGK